MGDRRRLDDLHVLAVDDNDDARDIFRAVISYAGALVTVATSAEKVLKVRSS